MKDNTSPVQALLRGPGARLRLEERGQVTSTNAVLQDMAARGEAEGAAVVAWAQSAGRGRRGRAFYSPPGTGLYLSLLLRPQTLSPQDTVLLTAAAAVAVAESIEEATGLSARIKWVNDVWVGERKVCGILAEGAVSPTGAGLDHVVLGIGVNLLLPPGGFPPPLDEVAGAIFPTPAAARQGRAAVAAGICNRFMAFYEDLPGRAFLPAYRARSFLLGREVAVHRGDAIRPAQALSLDENCRLLVRYPDGTQAWLDSGEVSLKAI